MSKKATKVLITAGPTREALDDVRYLSNHSTGTMGFELASACQAMGWDVTLVLGPVSTQPPASVHCVKVVSAAEMFEAVEERFETSDVLIAAAAVADYTPRHRVRGKIKKKPGSLLLELVRTVDILHWCGSQRTAGQTIVGFALEADGGEDEPIRKLKTKRCDLLVHNSPQNFGEGGGTVRVFLARNGSADVAYEGSPTKPELARLIVGCIQELREGPPPVPAVMPVSVRMARVESAH